MLPPILQKAQVFPVSLSNCKLVMGSDRIKPGMICAAGGGTDTCQVVKIRLMVVKLLLFNGSLTYMSEPVHMSAVCMYLSRVIRGKMVAGGGIRVQNYMINFTHATGCHCCTFGDILDGD